MARKVLPGEQWLLCYLHRFSVPPYRNLTPAASKKILKKRTEEIEWPPGIVVYRVQLGAVAS